MYTSVCTYIPACVLQRAQNDDVYRYVALQNDDNDNGDYPQQHVSDIQEVMIAWVCLLQTCARLPITQRNHS